MVHIKVVKMNSASRIVVMLIVAVVITGTFIYLGSLLPYPDNITVSIAGVGFSVALSLVLLMNAMLTPYFEH